MPWGPRGARWEAGCGDGHGIDVVGANGGQSASPAAVVLVADDVELLVELHIDLVAVVERDFDLVLALLVVDLRAGDSALSGVGEGCRACSLQGVAGDGGVSSVVFWSVVARRCVGHRQTGGGHGADRQGGR